MAHDSRLGRGREDPGRGRGRAAAQADPRRAVHGAVHQRLRHDGDERRGDVRGEEPRHHGLRRPVGARPLLARDGVVHADRRQARRRVGPPHDVHARHLHVRRRRADHRLQHGPADDDLRLVAARGPRLGADDPGDLRHRRHHLPGRQAARLGVRRRGRHGRHGRGARSAGLRIRDDLPHLARLVPDGGLRRPRHARPLHAHQGAQAAAAQGPARLPRRLPLRARSGARRARRAAGEQVRLDGRQGPLRRLGQDADPRRTASRRSSRSSSPASSCCCSSPSGSGTCCAPARTRCSTSAC